MKLIAVFLLFITCSVAQFTRATEPTESNSLMSQAIESLIEGATMCASLNQYDDAIFLYSSLVLGIPELYTLLHNLGYTLKKCGHMDGATKVYQEITKFMPNDTAQQCSLSLALLALNHSRQFDQPIKITSEVFQKSLTPEKEFKELFELASHHIALKKYAEAMNVYTKIFKHHPVLNMLLYNLEYTLKKSGYMDKAIEIHHKALEQIPDYLSEFCSLSLPLLLLYNYELSLSDNNSRSESFNEISAMLDQPVWDGIEPAGKTIMLHTTTEGLGDTFQLIRFAKLLKQRGATVIAKVQKPLKDILTLCDYMDTVVTSYENLPQFDAHFPMWGMMKTDDLLADIPYLYANAQLIDEWKEKLAGDTNFKIGVCWQTRKNHPTSKLCQLAEYKSISAHTLAPLTQVEGATVYSLEKFGGEDELEHLSNDCNIKSFGSHFDTQHGRFMDTAAIMKNLDLVITVDTAIAHLAGGLGIPTWLLLCESPDVRWSYNESESPFYPTMRLFRQTEDGNWQSVIEQVKGELLKLVQSSRE